MAARSANKKSSAAHAAVPWRAQLQARLQVAATHPSGLTHRLIACGAHTPLATPSSRPPPSGPPPLPGGAPSAHSRLEISAADRAAVTMRRQRRAAAGWPLAAAAAAVLLALAAATQAAAQQQGDWTVVTDPFATKLPGLEVAVVGPPQQPFARPPPRTLDPHLLADFAAQLNVLQDVSGEGDNTFGNTSPQVRGSLGGAADGVAGMGEGRA